MLRIFILSLFFALICIDASAQNDGCTITSLLDEEITIKPKDTIRLRLLVQDAQQPTIGTGGQGICGVDLSFEHFDATDLNISLYGPAIQSSILVGPALSVGSGQSLFPSTYDLSFVPSGTATFPDPGMMDQWDNKDLSGALALSGSYFPFGLDLDAAYTGSVEGVWELVIVDQFVSVANDGTFDSFSIQFCDENLTCTICEAESGTFTQDSITICEDGGFEIKNIYDPVSDPATYTDLPIAYSGTAPIFLDELSLPEGSFDLVVVTIESSQIASFKRFARGLFGGAPGLIDLVNTPGGKYCLDVAGPISIQVNRSEGNVINFEQDTVIFGCLESSVTLSARPSVIADSTIIEWRDSDGNTIGDPLFTIEVTEPGTYTFAAKGELCEVSKDITVVGEASLNKVEIIAEDIVLTCDQDTLALSVSETQDGATYDWRDGEGNIISDSTSIIISEAGMYTVDRVLRGCSSSDTILIIEDVEPPVPTVNVVGEISCIMSEVNVSFDTDEPIRALQWLDADDNLLSQDSAIQLSTPGSYILHVTDLVGCEARQSFEVRGDTSAPVLMGIPDTLVTLTCQQEQVSITPTSTDGSLSVTMSIDGGPFDLVSDVVTLSSAGIYDFVANYDNGCQDTKSFTIEDLRNSSDERLSDTTLTCLIDSIRLEFDFSLDDYTYTWSGETNITETGPNFVIVNTPGEVVLDLLDKRTGCLRTFRREVLSDQDKPNSIVGGDTIITCSDRVAELSVTLLSDESIVWTLPSGGMVTDANLSISTPGEYTYEISNDQGCTISDVWRIADGTRGPRIDLDSMYMLTCADPSTLLTIVDVTDQMEITWFYDDESTETGTSIEISDTRLDSVRILDRQNGCSTSHSFIVLEDKEIPDVVLLSNDTILCRPQTLELLAMSSSGFDERSVLWTVDGSSIGSGYMVSTDDIGLVSMTALDLSNGCSVTDSMTIALTDNPLIGIDMRVIDESCLGESDGEILVLEILGGEGVADFRFNKESTQQSLFDTLKPGDYEIYVEDNIGCTYDTTVTLGMGESIAVDLGGDRTANIDEQITITSATEGPIVDHGWYADGVFQSSPIDEYTHVIDGDLELILQAFSANGCEAIDTVFIDAVVPFDAIDMYIPNAFAPGGSDRNSTFSVDLPETVLSVQSVMIYDRWGGVLREHTPVAAAFVELWDGRTSDGQLVQPGVYTYVCEVITAPEGRTKIFMGTVNVLR